MRALERLAQENDMDFDMYRMHLETEGVCLGVDLCATYVLNSYS